MENCEWQRMREDEWAFGVKVRGVVRKRLAEVYYDEGDSVTTPGWRWIASLPMMPMMPMMPEFTKVERGVQGKLEWAIVEAEKALGIQR